MFLHVLLSVCFCLSVIFLIGFLFVILRDDPKDAPVFVASNAAKENCNISARGENLFAAIQ